MLKQRFVLFVGALCLLLSSSSAYAIPGIGDTVGLNPFWKYKTIETDHFRISFPEELTPTAQKAANYLEEAHAILSPALYWQASYRVNIVMIDNQDMENGLTSAALRLGIVLFVTPPDNWSSIAYYDNWLRELCIHEYTHFLNMDVTRDFWRVARYLFGDLLLPNTLWPSWMLEGFAVYNETRFTKAGRGRSPYYDMILRSAVLENVLDTRKFITLDKVNGRNPWYPGGETAYLFGYELMNKLAQTAQPGQTADKEGQLASGPDAIGVMSYRSGGRVPFFINGNLENITGKDWYWLWDEFVRSSREHAEKQLTTIRTQPVTSFQRMTQDGDNLYGPALSPDGRWIAYTQSDERGISGLHIRDRKTGKTTRLLDKAGGVSLDFTKDSRFLFESRLHRIRTYYFYSDIEVLDLSDGGTHWLTSELRAKDPTLSPDNHWIAFTKTENATTSLVLGELQFDGSEFKLGSTRVLYPGEKFDRVATPKFSPDGTKIAFSVHKNGAVGENILIYDLAKNTGSVLVQDGSLNRYPTWDTEGNLCFVSDRTGVDNLFRFPSAQLSNFETGVAFPAFSSSLEKNHYLATVFSTQGWDLADIELANGPYPSQTLTVNPPKGPEPTDHSGDQAENKTYDVSDYSLWPTILPRTWSPFFAGSHEGVIIGGEITGFDQVDRHRYILLGDYDTFVKKGDVYAVYDNRLLGATLEAAASIFTSWETASGNTLLTYGRKQEYSLAAYYTFNNTYSALTPRVSYNFMRESGYAVPTSGPDFLYYKSALVPNADATLFYTDQLSSPLAITPERGGSLAGGARVYLNSGENIWKGLATAAENFEIGDSHVVIQPSLKGSWVSHLSGYSPANVLVQGRYSNQLVGAIAADNYDHLGIHGYPLKAFYTRAATVGSGFVKFPLSRIFAGPGTGPVFLENLHGFGFGEATYFPTQDQVATVLPSAGAGITLDVDVAQFIPVTLTVEYDKGFRDQAGAKGEVYFQFGVQSLAF